MTSPVDSFLARFRAFGAAPSVERYRALFHPEATLFDSGMARPLPAPEIAGHFASILALIPDLHMSPERWRARDGTVFVDARNRATLAGRPLEWRAVYCVTLDGDLVRRGRRYYDRRPLFARLDPSLPELPGAPWQPATRGGLARAFPDAVVETLERAGDEALSFVEWRARARVGGAPWSWNGVDRFDADGVRAVFDTLELATRLAAPGAAA